mmetsp:Transcript_23820/g.34144  ORF Transcript_23820/g.34144 Transcript_23820/m.34144 type:complete len:153 (-) Transcript_23820:29-487(-)
MSVFTSSFTTTNDFVAGFVAFVVADSFLAEDATSCPPRGRNDRLAFCVLTRQDCDCFSTCISLPWMDENEGSGESSGGMEASTRWVVKDSARFVLLNAPTLVPFDDADSTKYVFLEHEIITNAKTRVLIGIMILFVSNALEFYRHLFRFQPV